MFVPQKWGLLKEVRVFWQHEARKIIHVFKILLTDNRGTLIGWKTTADNMYEMVESISMIMMILINWD